MIVSLGEALIDRIHGEDGTEPTTQIGGSPYNVAIALSRLELDAGFVCPLSSDAHGDLLFAGLQANGVHPCCSTRVEAPTAIAEVFRDENGHPRYVFHREKTADRALIERPPKSALPETLEALHFGSLVLAQEKDWPAWRDAIQHARSQGTFIAFDPNLRIKLIDDMAGYAKRLEEAIALSDLIKASDEDLSLLDPGCNPTEYIQTWCAPGRLVVLTEGKAGAQLWGSNGLHATFRDTPTGPIVDTVGAGDTFQAALLAWLSKHSAFSQVLRSETAHALLRFASHAAFLNCTQEGCQPPTLTQVQQSL